MKGLCVIIQYADDVTLIAETASGLQQQIDLCAEYGKKYGIQFNPFKTMIIIFNKDIERTPQEILDDQLKINTLNGEPIEVVKSFKVLGQIIMNDDLDCEHIAKRKSN